MNIVEKLVAARDTAEEIESNMVGMEIDHPEHYYCVVEMVEGDDVCLYCEDEEQNMYHDTISLEELENYLF